MSTSRPLAFATSMEHDASKPIHAGPNDSWHGRVGPDSSFAPEAGRYYLYVGLFCPFAHRANLVRHLKGLTDAIPVAVVRPYPKGDDDGWPGWKFPERGVDEYAGATTDPLFASRYLHELYFRADAGYKGRYSVPLLWDTKTGSAVNNESAEMLRWMQTGFDDILPAGQGDQQQQRGLILYPERLRARIDEIAVWMQRDLNTGVYKAGFAKDQETYDKNVVPVFAALNQLEKIIHDNGGPYVLGDTLTEIDILAYPTIIRFDVVYVQHFKCNLGTIRGSYPHINEWCKNLYHNVVSFKKTTDFRHIKENYTKSHPGVNPHAITPMGPFPDIENDVCLDFSKLRVGTIALPEVLEYQRKLT